MLPVGVRGSLGLAGEGCAYPGMLSSSISSSASTKCEDVPDIGVGCGSIRSVVLANGSCDMVGEVNIVDIETARLACQVRSKRERAGPANKYM